MLASQVLSVGQLKTNCYLVFDKTSKEGIIIDPGDEADFIIQKIQDFDFKPKAILATHCHFDHIMAVNELKAAFKIPFLASQFEESVLKRYRKIAIYYTSVDPGPPPIIDKYISDESFKNVEIIETPGHTPGSICLYFPKDKIIFTGDFNEYHKSSNKKDLTASTKKILALPKETIVYPGHEDPTSIHKLRSQFL